MTEIPLNAEQLGKAIGRSGWYVAAMKEAGYEMAYGTKDFPKNALKWLSQNRDFRTTGYSAAHRKPRPRQPVAVSGTVCG